MSVERREEVLLEYADRMIKTLNEVIDEGKITNGLSIDYRKGQVNAFESARYELLKVFFDLEREKTTDAHVLGARVKGMPKNLAEAVLWVAELFCQEANLLYVATYRAGMFLGEPVLEDNFNKFIKLTENYINTVNSEVNFNELLKEAENADLAN